MKIIPVNCPSCMEKLAISKLSCEACETTISGNFTLPVLMQLSHAEQVFVLQFMQASGSLKTMAGNLGKSYPTVRNRLDDLIDKINTLIQE